MSDLNRGIMKFDGADKPILVAVSAVLIFGGIIALISWALKSAYVVLRSRSHSCNETQLVKMSFSWNSITILCYDY